MPPRPPLRGDLVVVTPRPGTDATPAVCLVLDPHVDLDGDALVRVALTAASPELATDHDAVVPPDRSGVAWPVVVQRDLQGIVDATQVAEVVGHLDGGTLEVVNGLLARPAVGSRDGVTVGWRLAGPSDRRWGWKVAEGRRLDDVTVEVPW